MECVHFPINVSDCKRCPYSESLGFPFAGLGKSQADFVFVTPPRPPGGQCHVQFILIMHAILD